MELLERKTQEGRRWELGSTVFGRDFLHVKKKNYEVKKWLKQKYELVEERIVVLEEVLWLIGAYRRNETGLFWSRKQFIVNGEVVK